MMCEIKYGIVSEVKSGFAKVSFSEDGEGFVSDWLPMMVRKSKSDKDSWPLEVNEHVVCMIDEGCDTGVILGAIYNDEDRPDEKKGVMRKKFSDGTVIEYDKNTHTLKADVNGKVEISAALDVHVSTQTKITAEAVVQISATAPAVEITGSGVVNINAGVCNITAPITNVSGNLTVAGTLSAAIISSSGEISATGQISSSSDVKAGTTSLKNHVHPGVQTGGGSTGFPV